jgi:hypothetical protein
MCFEKAGPKKRRPSIIASLVVVVVVGAGLLSACASKNDEAAGRQGASGGATPATPQQSATGALATTIKAELNSDEQLRGSNLEVTANAQRKEATLSGTVESEAVKTRAVDTVKAAHPELTVNANIEVKAGCCGSEHDKHMPGMNGMPGEGHGMKGMPDDGPMRR